MSGIDGESSGADWVTSSTVNEESIRWVAWDFAAVLLIPSISEEDSADDFVPHGRGQGRNGACDDGRTLAVENVQRLLSAPSVDSRRTYILQKQSSS